MSTADELTPAQRKTILHLDECQDGGWASDVGFANTRRQTCWILSNRGLVEIGETQWRSEIVSGGWGRRWTTKQIGSTPIRLTDTGRKMAVYFKENR